MTKCVAEDTSDIRKPAAEPLEYAVGRLVSARDAFINSGKLRFKVGNKERQGPCLALIRGPDGMQKTARRASMSLSNPRCSLQADGSSEQQDIDVDVPGKSFLLGNPTYWWHPVYRE